MAEATESILDFFRMISITDIWHIIHGKDHKNRMNVWKRVVSDNLDREMRQTLNLCLFSGLKKGHEEAKKRSILQND